MKYILEISDSFYARDNECKHSLSSRLTKEFFEGPSDISSDRIRQS